MSFPIERRKSKAAITLIQYNSNVLPSDKMNCTVLCWQIYCSEFLLKPKSNAMFRCISRFSFLYEVNGIPVLDKANIAAFSECILSLKLYSVYIVSNCSEHMKIDFGPCGVYHSLFHLMVNRDFRSSFSPNLCVVWIAKKVWVSSCNLPSAQLHIQFIGKWFGNLYFQRKQTIKISQSFSLYAPSSWTRNTPNHSET